MQKLVNCKEKNNNVSDKQNCFVCGSNKHILRFNKPDGTQVMICDSCLASMYHLVLDRMIDSHIVTASDEFIKETKMITNRTEKFLEMFEREYTGASPKDIYKRLSTSVVGQESAKKSLSIALYNHMKRIHSDFPEKFSKSNVLLIGPTGSGKTLLAKTLSKIADVPYVIADATTLTPAGYMGSNVEDMLAALIYQADGDIETAERGIIYIDEIDKIKKQSCSSDSEVRGEAIQQGLLKLIEGTTVDVPIGNKRNRQTVKMSTENILFICGGAFVGLNENTEKLSDAIAGFTRNDTLRNTKSVQGKTERLINFGLIPEFIGRLPVVVTLDDLTEEDLIHILKDAKNSLLKQYQNLFLQDNIHLVIPDNVLSEIAHIAMKRNTGARGLRSIMEELLREAMFGLPYADDINVCEVTVDTLQTGRVNLYWSEDYVDEKEDFIISVI